MVPGLKNKVMDSGASRMHEVSIDAEHHHKAPQHILGIMMALFPVPKIVLLFL